MTPRPLFVSVDGPKGTGKSTLLAAIGTHTGATVLVEKDIDPHRREVTELLRQKNPGPNADRRIASALATGRAEICRRVLEHCNTELVIIDRWYPSDAVFRRFVAFEECLEINIRKGVWIPNLVLAISCPPEFSWCRATSRSRGLDSTSIPDFEAHLLSTHRFEEAAVLFGWHLIDARLEREAVLDNAMAAIIALTRSKS